MAACGSRITRHRQSPPPRNDIIRKYEAVSALKEQSDAVRALGATSLYLFGSMVRDAATSTSDLDLFIDYDRNSRFSLIELVGIKQLLEQRLGIAVAVTTRVLALTLYCARGSRLPPSASSDAGTDPSCLAGYTGSDRRTHLFIVMAGEGPPSTSLLPAQRKDMDADPSLRLGQALRRHDDGGMTVAALGAFYSAADPKVAALDCSQEMSGAMHGG